MDPDLTKIIINWNKDPRIDPETARQIVHASDGNNNRISLPDDLSYLNGMVIVGINRNKRNQVVLYVKRLEHLKVDDTDAIEKVREAQTGVKSAPPEPKEAKGMSNEGMYQRAVQDYYKQEDDPFDDTDDTDDTQSDIMRPEESVIEREREMMQHKISIIDAVNRQRS